VKPGDRVKRWQPIAMMGNSGKSTGPHLHYEVHLNDQPVNPLPYILDLASLDSQ
jgi:murein DD-endopeptidase MepM/ murein hydrolase activator NlpD